MRLQSVDGQFYAEKLTEKAHSWSLVSADAQGTCICNIEMPGFILYAMHMLYTSLLPLLCLIHGFESAV